LWLLHRLLPSPGGNCVLACPQVDTTIKHYLVQTHLAEGMAELLAGGSNDELLTLDLIWGTKGGNHGR
jgi:hypothetical protein